MKRLIEEDFPIFEVSRESAREKSIRHGHISTLHIWWARRPLAACRAAIFASLVPDPATLAEPVPEYVDFLLKALPAAPKESEVESPGVRARKRLVKFTADISPWEASTDQRLLKTARKVVEVGTAVIDGLRNKELTEVIEGTRKVDTPKVLDPFAGGGSIPLEALRLGCEAYAIDYNPVAVLILKATLEYPQKYGERLVKDVEKWGRWILEEARKEIGRFYPEEGDSGQKSLIDGSSKGRWTPVGYIWARTIQCQNPACGAEIPLMRQFWLRRQEDSEGRIVWSDSIYLHPVVHKAKKRVDFEIVRGKQIEGFDPSKGTRPTPKARSCFVCPVCTATYKQKDIRRIAQEVGLGQRLMVVVNQQRGDAGRTYRIVGPEDRAAYEAAAKALQHAIKGWQGEYPLVPDEPLPYLRSIFNVHVYGMRTWGALFNARQLLCLAAFLEQIRKVRQATGSRDEDHMYSKIVGMCLSLVLDRLVDYNSTLATWVPAGEFIGHTFTRQALPMVWDFHELNPFSDSTGAWTGGLNWVTRVISHCATVPSEAHVAHGTATSSGMKPESIEAAITDPPYYDNVPYADLSDFFYVWLKRAVGDLYPEILATPLTPKSEEIVQLAERNKLYQFKTKQFYEDMMGKAFSEMNRVVERHGIVTVIFAHKTTAAWETLVNALVRAGLVPTSSWPIHTEMGARLRARESAALASSFFLACRKREGNETAYYKDIKHELNKRIVERLDHFWEQGIRGADFFISAIGPAVEVFGQYEKVKKLSGEEVSVAELLNEVRGQVTEYALSKILHGVRLEKIDPLSRFYVLWRWTYNGETVPYDDARKLSQAVGIEVDSVRGKGKLVSGKDKIVVAKPEQRDVDELARRQPVSMIDALHKACLLWKADKRKELEKFLADVGLLDEPTFWEMAQALSELLPDGDKEKQMIQGLLMRAPTMRREAGRQLSLDERWKA